MNKKGKSTPAMIIAILMLVIVLLIAVIVYSFIVKPKFNAYVVNKQLEARDSVLSTVLLQLQQQGYVQITDAQGNKIILVPVSPEQLAQAQAGQQAISDKQTIADKQTK